MLLRLYDYFKAHKVIFYLFLVISYSVLLYLALQVKIEEDVSKFFPQDKKIESLNTVFKNSRFADRLVFMLSSKDLTHPLSPDSLLRLAEQLTQRISKVSGVREISFRVNDELAQNLLEEIYEHLAVFLEEGDYALMDSLVRPSVIGETVRKNFRTLTSPGGVALRPFIERDPLGLAKPVWQRLQEVQVSGEYVIYDNAVFSKDLSHLVFFVRPAFAASETNKARLFFDEIDPVLNDLKATSPRFDVRYFGTHAVAAGNAARLKDDTVLTISIMVVFLIAFLGFFFRRKRAPFILLLPVVVGCTFGLAMMFLIQGSISILALAAGAIVLGVAVDYSLHFISYLHYQPDAREVIKDLLFPLTIGSATTVLAFFSLEFVNAEVLKDFGLFAGCTLVGAALSTLIFLPHLVKPGFLASSPGRFTTISSFRFDKHGYVVAIILLLTPVFLYFAFQVKFNSDMNQLNFMTDDLHIAESELNSLNRAGIKSIFIISEGANLEEALNHSQQAQAELEVLKGKGAVSQYTHLTSFYPSAKIQENRIKLWKSFWQRNNKDQVFAHLSEEGKKAGFNPTAFDRFHLLAEKEIVPLPMESFQLFRDNLFTDNLIVQKGKVLAVMLAQSNDRGRVYHALEGTPHAEVADRQLITSRLVALINQDFNFIVASTSIVVFLALLLAYGRLELTLITFVPMLITWIWILGFMGLLGIEFNIVNVIVSTFIFGLGDDYSIFIMDGLQKKLRYGIDHLPSVRVSIFLSAMSTLAGLGVLIFAKHPALRSIASISIIGIACVVVMSQTLEPFFFRLMISGPASRQQLPRRAWGTVKSVTPYVYFVGGSFILTLLGFLMFKVWPFQRERMKLAFHFLMSKVTGWIFPISGSASKKVIGADGSTFKTPAVIIANHQSILDILATISLHPKILLVTNLWVWNSPIFGFVVRLAEYYPIMEGTEENISRMRERVNQGYSILVFPEGTRAPDDRLKRFHKGAFLIAEKLGIDLLPLVIHGSGNLIPKGELYVEKGTMTLKFLPRIAPDDGGYGMTYSERTKKISSYFKEEYEKLSRDLETPEYFRRKLINNYLFKGPVLEWYLRIKLRLEKNYELFHQMVPREAQVLDLGCGYGFLCYMLHFLSEGRQITGVDYDEDKIETANHCYSKNERIKFECSDITTYALSGYDVIIISDVLHYLNPEQQVATLNHCFEALNPGGKLIIREGNKDLAKKHKGTQLTEFFSVKLIKFNKSNQNLSFMSGKAIRNQALAHNFEVEIVDDSRFTSNVIFVLKKKVGVYE